MNEGANFLGNSDADVVRLPKFAGAVSCGKQAMIAQAVGGNGACVRPAMRNARDWLTISLDVQGLCRCGAGLGYIAPDKEGSICDPAARFDVAGMKRADELVSRSGVLPRSHFMDRLGLLLGQCRIAR